jgi:PAS domain S-box-containing protein
MDDRSDERILPAQQPALDELGGLNAQVIDCVEEGVVVYDTDLRLRHWNPFMERLTRRAQGEVLGRRPEEVFPVLEDVGVVERLRDALLGKVSQPLEFRYTGPGEVPGWLSESCGPLYSRSGEIVGVISTMRETTAARRAEEEEQRLRAELAQAQRLEAVGRLAGGIAHDFNNILSVILANVEYALERLDEAAPLRAELLEIRQVADRSANLTRQLLGFARRQPAAPRDVDLNEVIGGTLTMLRRLVGENVELSWSAAQEPCVVSIDPSQLDQILTNLCVNARDAIHGAGRIVLETRNVERPPPGRAPAVEVTDHGWALLSVSDTGCGMTQEVLDHAFDPFFSTKEPGRGTGLGLATVYGIVKQNDGVIDVESAPDRGTIFSIYLPRRAAARAHAAPRKPAGARATGAETVLLVEDEGAVRRVAVRALERLGYRVFAAETPGHALRLAAEHGGAIDLLVTDVVMPEMDGVELARRLDAVRPGLKRLFMSGYPPPLTSERGTLQEGVCFLGKPFTPTELAEKVREALGATAA